jgi:hypothetical protein
MKKMIKQVWCVMFGYVVTVQWDADWQRTHYEPSFEAAMDCIRAYPVECIVMVKRRGKMVMKRGHEVKVGFLWPTWGAAMYRSWFV